MKQKAPPPPPRQNTYPSDLTDAQWALVEPHVPPQRWGGRTREVSVREVFNGLPYPSTVRHYCYDRFRDDGTWEHTSTTCSGPGAGRRPGGSQRRPPPCWTASR